MVQLERALQNNTMKTKRDMRLTRKARIRAKIVGTSTRPRLAVFRSNTALSAQVIDDSTGRTLVSKSMKGKNKKTAKILGAEIAKLCKTKGITRVVFDRGGYRYHGTLTEFASSVREGGVVI